MALFDFLRKKGKRTVTDEQRERSLEARRVNAELTKLDHKIKIMEKKLELEERKEAYLDMKEELYGDEEREEAPTWEDQLAQMFMAKLLSGNTNPNPGTVPNTNVTYNKQDNVRTVNTPEMSDQEITHLLNQIPKKQRNMLKKLSLEQFVKLAHARLPGLSDETIKRGFELLQEM